MSVRLERYVDVTTLTTAGDNSLLRGVRSVLGDADHALLCVAFVHAQGIHLVRQQLQRLGPNARLLATTVFGDSSAAALARAVDLGVDVRVLNPGGGTYHPKVYLGRGRAGSGAVVGSANLTGGLVNNVESAMLVRGAATDAPIRELWDWGENLWTDGRAVPWIPPTERPPEDRFPPELYAQLVAVVAARGGVFETLGPSPKINTVTEVTPTGLYIETSRSRAKGEGPQFVPAWMFGLAWDYLRSHGELSNRYLVADDGLNVKRSSAVCAILATLPGVTRKPGTGTEIVLAV